MAVINSLAIGAGVKSAGNLTYRRTRGRTIASQRVTENKSNTPLQALQRNKFRVMSQLTRLLAAHVDNAFSKTKYGSARNNFIKQNKDTLADVNIAALSQAIQGRLPMNQFIPTLLNMDGSAEGPIISILSSGDSTAWAPDAAKLVNEKSNAASMFILLPPSDLEIAKVSIQLIICTSNMYSIKRTTFDEAGTMVDTTAQDYASVTLTKTETGYFSGATFNAGAALEAGDAVLISIKYDNKVVTVPYAITAAGA